MNAEQEIYDTGPEPVEPQPEPVGPRPTPVAPPAGPPEPLSPEDERLWAMLAHLSVLLNLVTGFLGVAAALVIYLIYRDRSRYVAFQALQAFLFQILFWAGGGVLIGTIGVVWAIVTTLSVVIIGVLLIPLAILATIVFALMPIIAVVYGVVGGIETNSGKDFRYWLVGDWALNLLH
jgi:hypothetical protein